MNEPARHEMQLTRTLPSGEEEWFCPTCSRRFVMRWFPKYAKLVLEPGDEYALHSGSKGEMLRLGDYDDSAPAEVFPPAADAQLHPSFEAHEQDDTPDSSALQPWRDWLDSAEL
ncbi:hypothetical protein SE17_31050 [Kouleothrix aurantiaca]|uniref:Uncharacterized protein n=1 Tax=Kouleothrix aurantiaca TaxID=186479 RepID=A0A0P9F086_9CHLR|nr:hypothetical protein SE17_31050 [Kouleothrix aurantiaca]